MARERSTPVAQVVRFARPNIQIYDAHVVDLYQWVGARYLVGVKGAETKAKRSQAWLSTEFENGSRWIFTNPVAPREIRRSAIEKQKFTFYFNMIWRREWDSNPRYGRSWTSSSRATPSLGHSSQISIGPVRRSIKPSRVATRWDSLETKKPSRGRRLSKQH
jgi:hypothetical protein